MTDDHTRLENFKPFLRYDSNESYFADRACEMTDAPGNLLRSASGETIARAGPGERDLSLRFLVGACEHYPTGAIASEGDRLSIQGRDYLDQYRRIRPEGDYADVVYGRAVENEDSRWLQYWFWYFYDDVRALDVGLGLHEGDWEGIELRLDGEVPNLAVYAQHNYAEARHWDDVEKVGQRPVVYVALGSHASYFDDGMPITHWQRTKYFIDRSDGKVTPKGDVRLEILPGPAPGWARWPGHWGDTEKPTSGPKWYREMSSGSATGPGKKDHWFHPGSLLLAAEREGRAPGVTAFAPPEAPSPVAAPRLTAHMLDDRLGITYDVSARPSEEQASHLLVTVNSPQDRYPPATFRLGLDGESGEVEVPLDIDPAHHYELRASALGPDGGPSPSVKAEVGPTTEA